MGSPRSSPCPYHEPKADEGAYAALISELKRLRLKGQIPFTLPQLGVCAERRLLASRLGQASVPSGPPPDTESCRCLRSFCLPDVTRHTGRFLSSPAPKDSFPSSSQSISQELQRVAFQDVFHLAQQEQQTAIISGALP